MRHCFKEPPMIYFFILYLGVVFRQGFVCLSIFRATWSQWGRTKAMSRSGTLLLGRDYFPWKDTQQELVRTSAQKKTMKTDYVENITLRKQINLCFVFCEVIS